MRFLLYIIIAAFVTFEAAAQSKTPQTGSGNTESEIYPLGVSEETADASVMTIEAEPDVFPQLNGGPTDFLHYIGTSVRYPESALRDNVEGKVMVLTTIGPDGIVRDASILQGVRQDLDAEALRLVREMPAWHPAEKDGKTVATRAVVVVPFSIEKNPEPFK